MSLAYFSLAWRYLSTNGALLGLQSSSQFMCRVLMMEEWSSGFGVWCQGRLAYTADLHHLILTPLGRDLKRWRVVWTEQVVENTSSWKELKNCTTAGLPPQKVLLTTTCCVSWVLSSHLLWDYSSWLHLSSSISKVFALFHILSLPGFFCMALKFSALFLTSFLYLYLYPAPAL